MKLVLKIVVLLLLPASMISQTWRQIDSAYLLLQNAANDTVRMAVFSMLGGLYDDVNADSGLYYCNKGIVIAEKLDLQLNKAMMTGFMAWPLMKTGNYPEALKVINKGLKIADDPSNGKKAGYLQKGQTLQSYRLSVIGMLYSALEYLYLFVGNYEKQMAVAQEAIRRLETVGDTFNLAGIYPDIGDSYLKLNKLDSALFYQQKSLNYYSKLSFEERKFEGSTYTSIGAIYEQMGNFDLASENYQKAIEVSEEHDNPRHVGNASLRLANLYQSIKKTDSAFHYAKKAIVACTQGGYKKEVAIAYRMISDYYLDKKNTDSSYAYLRKATVLDDSLDRIEKTRLQEFQVAAFNQQLELQQLEQEQIEKTGKLKSITIIALIAIFSTIGFLLYRNTRQKQKANQILQEKNIQIEQTLGDLKATQKQLIQSEKMASLGELTAGIAHEIQNPLNFVNNFSELNKELVSELNDEIKTINVKTSKSVEIINVQKTMLNVQELIGSIKDNSEKINQHGQRASSIVNGMLEHSRKTSGEKSLTNINALCEEYIKLSYQSMRSKDPNLPTGQAGFAAEYKLDLDPDLPKINVVAQDISRVILNIVNNAFQACQEKYLLGLNRGNHDVDLVGLPQNQEEYKPVVLLATKFSASLRLPTGQAGLCEICISDNGPGIPDSIKDKIFQPFFTTKPTGQGTGLGLSLAYDIVKAHGGDLMVETNIGESPFAEKAGSRFIIKLPID